jgi:hypothetical protein
LLLLLESDILVLLVVLNLHDTSVIQAQLSNTTHLSL